MKWHKLLTTLSISLVLVFGSGAASAAVTWYFFDDGTGTDSNAGNFNVGTSKVYHDSSACGSASGPPISGCVGGTTLTAYGYDPLGTAEDILENNRSGVEDGLGVASGTPEIDDVEVIVIDLGVNWASLTDYAVRFNSVDSGSGGETAVLKTAATLNGAQSAGVSVAHTVAGANTDYFGFTANRFLFITVEGNSGVDILLNSITAVPIPAAVWLFGSALLGIVGFARRNSAVSAA